jgi:hypothetical protein
MKPLFNMLATVVVLTGLAAAVLVLAPLPAMPETGVHSNVLLRNIRLLAVERGEMTGPRDVLVRAGLIVRISAAGQLKAASDMLEIDGTGKYAIPGLWDMHTHSTKLSAQYLHPLFLANGVTGVREMWGCMSEPDSYIACQEERVSWNEDLDEGGASTPRYLQHSSFQINGGNEVPDNYPDFFRVRNDDDARELAAYYANAGADFLKIYSELSPEAYRKLAGEARAHGLSMAGHRPLGVSLPELIAAGQRSVEHPRLFLMECYRGASEFRALDDPLAAYNMDLRRKLVQEHDTDRCARLMASMASAETAWVPTLQVLAMSARAGEAVFRNDPRLKYIPWPIREGMWMPDADNAATKSALAGHANTYEQLYRLAQRNLVDAHQAGVELLVGTDAGDTYIFPGFSVHDELREFVEAGISAADTLRMATLGAATFSGLDHQYGSIEEGKAADILVLNENPLDNIEATRGIHSLLFNGQFFNRAALDELLSFAEQQSNGVQFNLKLVWSMVSSPIVRVQFAD